MNTSLDVLIQAVNYVDSPVPARKTQPPALPSQPSEHESDFSCGSTIGSPHSPTVTEDDLPAGGQGKPVEAGQRKDKKTRRKSAAALSRQASSSAASASSDSWRTSAESKRGGVKKNHENRSVHNVLEKNRRAHLKDCFEALKNEVLENEDDKKASHLAVLRSAVRCIQQLQRESGQMQRDSEKAGRDRSAVQLRLQELKHEMLLHNPSVDVSSVVDQDDSPEEVDSQATCTAPPGSPPVPPQPHHHRHLPHVQLRSSPLPPTLSQESTYTLYHSPSQHPISLPTNSQGTVKSVTDIVDPVGSEAPLTQQSAGPSCSARDKLPLRKRILQDEQVGLFVTKQEEATVQCDSQPNILVSMPQFWPAGPASFIPTMQMYSSCTNGTTTQQPTFGLVPMNMMNQFYLPVTHAPYGGTSTSAVTSPLMAHLPQVFMLPPSSYTLSQASGQPPPTLTPPSSSATSSMLSMTPSLRYTST